MKETKDKKRNQKVKDLRGENFKENQVRRQFCPKKIIEEKIY